MVVDNLAVILNFPQGCFEGANFGELSTVLQPVIDTDTTCFPLPHTFHKRLLPSQL